MRQQIEIALIVNDRVIACRLFDNPHQVPNKLIMPTSKYSEIWNTFQRMARRFWSRSDHVAPLRIRLFQTSV